MAGERETPGLGLKIGWDDGSSGYAPDINTSFRLLSAIVQGMVVSRTTSLPGTPSVGEEGFIYIVPEGDSNEFYVAIWDEDLDTETPGWVFISPRIGWSFYVNDEAQYVSFQGYVDGWEPLNQHIGMGGGDISFETRSASGAFVAGDFDGTTMQQCTNSSDITLTIPASLTVTGMALVWRAGTGNVTIAGAGGVTVNAADDELTLNAQHSTCAIIQTAADTYLVVGDLTSAP